TDDQESSAHKIPSQDEAISETVESEEGVGGPHDAYGLRPNERTFEEEPSEESSNDQPGEEERRGSQRVVPGEQKGLALEDECHRVGEPEEGDDARESAPHDLPMRIEPRAKRVQEDGCERDRAEPGGED